MRERTVKRHKARKSSRFWFVARYKHTERGKGKCMAWCNQNTHGKRRKGKDFKLWTLFFRVIQNEREGEIEKTNKKPASTEHIVLFSFCYCCCRVLFTTFLKNESRLYTKLSFSSLYLKDNSDDDDDEPTPLLNEMSWRSLFPVLSPYLISTPAGVSVWIR